ncbi:uncharacterized protein OCT59_028637 [Rhizophagus irregularis]|uniref:uncharacterized protein n=1 Tax=Rhizophagus irregularis TaxID=588596 RepID=UPI000CCA6057|nr:hypothetical protein OCT59_028637 [Rhizophagus irregularis]GBC52767.1 hypothetical protein GLOIN_2v1843260 [Rhizophagus irregularis DAOM 181602=DAOM 197198]
MTSSQPAAPSQTANNTSTDTTMEEAMTSSPTHALSHNEIELTSRDSHEQDVHTQTPITDKLTNMDVDPIDANPDKGKSPETQSATQTNTPNPLHITVLTDIFTHTPQVSNKVHKGFIPRDSFQSKLSNNDIINLIKTSFIKDSNAFRFDVNTTSTYRYFTIHFRTRDSLDQYIANSPDSLKNIKIYELTNEAINTLIEQKFSNLDQAVIKIMDIPYNYDTSMLIKHLAAKTGSNIIEHKEIKKPPRKIPNRNNRGRPIFIKPAYKQLIVQFDKQAAYDYFMKENYWSLEIENFVVRILPGNTEDPEYKIRTSNYFKITGLPLNTTAKDIEPLIKHVYGRTCTFTQTTKYSTMKNAYIYVSPNNYPVDASNGASSLFEGYNLHVLPGHLSLKTCNICGSPLHETINCDDKNFDTDHNNRKIFKKRFIKRNEEKITINDNHRTRFNHVITLNANKRSPSMSHDPKTNHTPPHNYNNKKYQQAGSSLYPRQTKQPTNNHNNYDKSNKDFKHDNSYIAPHLDNPQRSDTNRYEQRITQLERQVESLLNSVKTLQEGKSKVDNTIADIHHNHNLMSSSLNDITIRLDKYDTILQQLSTNISLLSQEKITQHRERNAKPPKRPAPYEQTSYKATKNRYNLRGNKQGNISAEDSEQHHLATDDDTDAPDDAAMSDGAVFEGIIDEVSNASSSEPKFSVKSYNPLNLLPQFNATR